jgi:proline iminopeptidase
MRLFCIGILVALTAATPPGASRGEHRVRTPDGVALWYRVAGVERGAPVIFLHGGPGEGSQVMQALGGPALEKRVRMVYLDQRGSGLSERPKDKRFYSLALLEADVDVIRRELGADKIVLLAHSAGTPIALDYAADHPEHVAGVILTGAVPDIPAATDGLCDLIKARFPALYPKAVAAAEKGRRCDPFAMDSSTREAFFEKNMFPDPLVRDRVNWLDGLPGVKNSGVLGSALFSEGLQNYRFNRPEGITMPLLFLAGSRYIHTALRPQQALARKVRNGRVVMIPGGGHFAFADQPERFASEVGAFVNRVSR